MPEDEVQFIIIPTLVWSEHDGVGGLVVELAEIRLGVSSPGQKLDVRAAAVLTLLW